jgi:hypothetical protein
MGVALLLFPGPMLKALLRTTPGFGFGPIELPPEAGTIIARLLGVALIALVMFMILVAQKIEAVWWWSWAFVIADGAAAAIILIRLTFGTPAGAPTLVWWIVLALCLGLGTSLIWGLFKAAQDQPIIDA